MAGLFHFIVFVVSLSVSVHACVCTGDQRKKSDVFLSQSPLYSLETRSLTLLGALPILRPAGSQQAPETLWFPILRVLGVTRALAIHKFLLSFRCFDAGFHYGALADLELIFSCLNRLCSWGYRAHHFTCHQLLFVL